MPKVLEPGVLYVSEEYGAAAHLCACGCGAKIRTPLGPAQWRMYESKDGPSLYPSVGNWQQPCRSHYVISRGKIRWYDAWTAHQVEAGRRHERDRMSAHLTQLAVERLLAAAVPERAAEIERLIQQYDLTFHIASDSPGFMLEGAFSLVRFTERTLDQIWVMGHAAWRAFEEFGAYLATFADSRITRAEIDELGGQQDAEQGFDLGMSAVEAIGGAERDGEIVWPVGVPPRAPDAGSVEQQATFDLTILATAYVFLHEAQHVAFAASDDPRPELRDEELACDRFAREFMLSRSESVAVTTKRMMGIAVGLFFIVVLTPPAQRVESLSHPGLVHRLTDGFSDPGPSPLLFFCSLLLAWHRRAGSLPNEILFVDHRDLLEQLIAMLEA